MAGRYLIVEFDDKDAAEMFSINSTLSEQLGFKVRAMYLKPNKFCDCPDKAKHTMGNWRKHPRYGLYVCSRCKKPSRHHQTGIVERLQYVFGFNLLNKVS